MAVIRIKRGTRAQIDTAAGTSSLLAGEPYLDTTNGKLLLGLTTSTYAEVGPGAAGSTVTANVVVDFGTVPVHAKTFSGISAPGITAAMVLTCSVSADMPGTLRADELELEPLTVHARATAANVIEVTVASHGGPVSGERRIHLLAAA
jgi:hypothetical protein